MHVEMMFINHVNGSYYVKGYRHVKLFQKLSKIVARSL